MAALLRSAVRDRVAARLALSALLVFGLSSVSMPTIERWTGQAVAWLNPCAVFREHGGAYLVVRNAHAFEVLRVYPTCTFFHLALGLAPLVRRGSWTRWSAAAVTFGAATLLLNQLRLHATVYLAADGYPWWIAGDAVSVSCYGIALLIYLLDLRFNSYRNTG